MVNDDIVDYAVLGAVARLLKKKFPQIVESYIKDALNYVAGIFDGIEKGDAKIIAQNAHPLKSASNGIGVVVVHEMAKALEVDARIASEGGISVDHMKQAAEDIRVALGHAIPLLQSYVNKTKE